MKREIFCIIGLLLVSAIILGAKEKGYLGVYHENLSEIIQSVIGVKHGVLINKVVENSPAEESGIKKGDVILAINGEEIEDEDEFSNFIGENPGEFVELTILRGGKELKLKAKLDEKEVKAIKGTININIGDSNEDVPGVTYMVFLIPIIAIVMSLLIPIMAFYFGYRKHVLKNKERMLAIEKGIEIPPEPIPSVKIVTPLDTLRKGFICLGIGIALVITSLVTEIELWFLGSGLVLLFIGVALVFWYHVATRKEKEK